MPPPLLRERQADLVRESLLGALTEALDANGTGHLTMEQVARRAGVSRRTLYRYFPDRDALFAACRERLERRLGMAEEIDAPDEIAASFARASRGLERSPDLLRALTRAAVRRAAGPPRPTPRVRAIRASLADVAAGLGAAELSRAAAVIAHLCSSTAWLALTDEAGLNPEQARQATSWAVNALIADLRRRGDEPHSKEL